MDNDLSQSPRQEVTAPILQPQTPQNTATQPLDVQPQPTIPPEENNKKPKNFFYF